MGSSTGRVEIIQYLVDTRRLWPQAAKTKDLENEASQALALLSREERDAVLRYYFVADAKMSLVSALLKHWVVSRYAGVPWRATQLTRDANKKPIFVLGSEGSNKQPVAFNVSHQAGLVALVAVAGYADGEGVVDVGVDIVCTSERRARDHKIIASQGWPNFVDMHSDVFGRSEAGYLKRQQQDRAGPREDELLRQFYTLWCLREAYVKMTGEALLAPWLKDLEFRGFRAPEPGEGFVQRPDGFDDGGSDELVASLEVIREHNVVFKEEKVEDANICLRSLGPDYMTCTAVRTPARREDALGWKLGPFQFLTLDEIIAHAEAHLRD
ncbi:4'-phosphopantetheinyl transferase [Durotheca rogersii]|uniref:4'-phosphopantetheinyl transferase n=1 Tax=Durotheca rogersii TaxID=419775 RepID=UPI00221EC8E6|nr:4'-phosphopantetheinyl transferase [Durotheca rogersii]KAI5860627.1 4'-phosphopantetheinyl transferase [Durotheca rogersii]